MFHRAGRFKFFPKIIDLLQTGTKGPPALAPQRAHVEGPLVPVRNKPGLKGGPLVPIW